MTKIKKLHPESDALEQRFPDGDVIALDIIDGWDDLDEDQQRYMIEYIRWFPKKTQSALKAGINTGRVRNWFKNSEPFIQYADTIRELYAESLHFVHLGEAVGNSKTRAGELRALEAEGWKKESSKSLPKNQQNNFYIGDKGGLAGLVEAVQDAESEDDD
jgi:hypothetical protein